MGALEPVLIAAVIVFVLNAAGSFIEFNTVLFTVVFGTLVYLGKLHLTF
jgi:hypothetical protein